MQCFQRTQLESRKYYKIEQKSIDRLLQTNTFPKFFQNNKTCTKFKKPLIACSKLIKNESFRRLTGPQPCMHGFLFVQSNQKFKKSILV